MTASLITVAAEPTAINANLVRPRRGRDGSGGSAGSSSPLSLLSGWFGRAWQSATARETCWSRCPASR